MRIKTGILFLLAGLAAGLVSTFLPISGSAQEEKTDLTLNFVRDGYYREITAGEEFSLLLEVRNTGTEIITDILLTAVPPEDWTLTLDPENIPQLTPGDFQNIDVVIRSPDDTVEDTYMISIRADATDIHRSITSSVLIKEPKGIWWIIGGILAAVFIVGLFYVYFRYNKQ